MADNAKRKPTDVEKQAFIDAASKFEGKLGAMGELLASAEVNGVDMIALLDVRDEYGTTALMKAAHHGENYKIDALIAAAKKSGIDMEAFLNAQNKFKNTALIMASFSSLREESAEEMQQKLTAAGLGDAEIKIKTHQGAPKLKAIIPSIQSLIMAAHAEGVDILTIKGENEQNAEETAKTWLGVEKRTVNGLAENIENYELVIAILQAAKAGVKNMKGDLPMSSPQVKEPLIWTLPPEQPISVSPVSNPTHGLTPKIQPKQPTKSQVGNP